MKVLDPITHKLRDSKDLQFVDKLFMLKQTKGVWAVLDEIVRHWVESNPVEYQSFVVDVEQKKSTRHNTYGSNKSKTLRSTLDVPSDIIYRIRRVYNASELPLDKEFFDYMYKNYPFMRVADRK